MKLITNSYRRFCRIMCMLLALHFFNLSIDSKDPLPDNIPEDLAINDIETFAEFFAEIVFGWHNAIEEHDERDSDDGGSQDFYKYYHSNPSLTLTYLTSTRHLSQKFQIRNSEDISSLSRDINSPPPKA